eukprot:575812-Hanusia_phi.AAC.3
MLKGGREQGRDQVPEIAKGDRSPQQDRQGGYQTRLPDPRHGCMPRDLCPLLHAILHVLDDGLLLLLLCDLRGNKLLRREGEQERFNLYPHTQPHPLSSSSLASAPPPSSPLHDRLTSSVHGRRRRAGEPLPPPPSSPALPSSSSSPGTRPSGQSSCASPGGRSRSDARCDLLPESACEPHHLYFLCPSPRPHPTTRLFVPLAPLVASSTSPGNVRST